MIKFRKELKPELKELKELIVEKAQVNWENKPLKVEFPEKNVINEPKNNKEIVENPAKIADTLPLPGPLADPSVLVRLLAARIDDLERRLATGKAFIRPSERPEAVGIGKSDDPRRAARRGGLGSLFAIGFVGVRLSRGQLLVEVVVGIDMVIPTESCLRATACGEAHPYSDVGVRQ